MLAKSRKYHMSNDSTAHKLQITKYGNFGDNKVDYVYKALRRKMILCN